MQVVTRAISAKYIFDGKNLLKDKMVLMADQQIVDIINKDKVKSNSYKFTGQIEDFGNCVISPGFIDLQLNGCGGALFNADISCKTLETMHQTNLRFGTTGFLPTLISADFKDLLRALEVVKKWFELYGNQRGVLGIHLEGPFLSVEKSGIHPKEYIIKPGAEMLEQIVSYTKYFPVKMTVAPESVSVGQIDYLVKHGVIVSLGHSNAAFEQAQAAFDHGAITATHIFNAMSGMTGRNPGLVAAILANPCYVGIIADLLHVDKANIQLITKLKPNQVYLVTDAVTPTGTDMTEFDFAGKHLHVQDGKCLDANGTLGGANLTMNQAVKNCVEACGISLEQALAMATSIPAKVLNLDYCMGKIAHGYRANLIALNLADYICKVL